MCSICQAQEITSQLKPKIEIINISTSYHFWYEVVTIVPSSVQCTKEAVFFPLLKKKKNQASETILLRISQHENAKNDREIYVSSKVMLTV